MKLLTVAGLVCAMIVVATAGAIRRNCPNNWTKLHGRCFKYVPQGLSWSEAEKRCVSMGANLASVHSSEEYHDIQRMIVKATHKYETAWLGGSDCQNEGIWLWSDGTPFNYKHCGSFNNNMKRQHCLQMNYGDQKCWDDVECYAKRPFVCAIKPKKFRG